MEQVESGPSRIVLQWKSWFYLPITIILALVGLVVLYSSSRFVEVVCKPSLHAKGIEGLCTVTWYNVEGFSQTQPKSRSFPLSSWTHATVRSVAVGSRSNFFLYLLFDKRTTNNQSSREALFFYDFGYFRFKADALASAMEVTLQDYRDAVSLYELGYLDGSKFQHQPSASKQSQKRSLLQYPSLLVNSMSFSFTQEASMLGYVISVLCFLAAFYLASRTIHRETLVLDKEQLSVNLTWTSMFGNVVRRESFPLVQFECADVVKKSQKALYAIRLKLTKHAGLYLMCQSFHSDFHALDRTATLINKFKTFSHIGLLSSAASPRKSSLSSRASTASMSTTSSFSSSLSPSSSSSPSSRSPVLPARSSSPTGLLIMSNATKRMGSDPSKTNSGTSGTSFSSITQRATDAPAGIAVFAGGDTNESRPLPPGGFRQPPPFRRQPSGLELLCRKCSVRKTNVAFLPCGDVCVCSECGQSVVTCPLCNVVVTDRVVVYAPPKPVG